MSKTIPEWALTEARAIMTANGFERAAKIAEDFKALPSAFWAGSEQSACFYGQEAAAGSIASAIRDRSKT